MAAVVHYFENCTADLSAARRFCGSLVGRSFGERVEATYLRTAVPVPGGLGSPGPRVSRHGGRPGFGREVQLNPRCLGLWAAVRGQRSAGA